MIGFLILIHSIFSITLDHDIHVSNTDIYIDDSGTAQITVKTFFDDLQTSFGLIPGEELPEDYTSANELIQKFINENLFIHVNKVPIKLNLKETTLSNPAIWIEITSPHKFNKGDEIEVYNLILVSTYSDQQNIVKIENGKDEKMIMLDSKNTAIKYKLSNK